MGLDKKTERAIAKIETACRASDRAQGALDGAMQKLEAMGYASLEQAEAALATMEADSAELGEELAVLIDDFTDRYDI